MVDDITNKVLLEHMQAMKYALEKRLDKVERRLDGVEMKLGSLEEQTGSLQKQIDEGFADAMQHRQALQEDLDATIRMQGKHQEQLARLGKS